MGNPDPELVVLCLLGGLLSALTVATVYYLSTRIRKAEEGYVAVIEQMDRFKRTAGPGYYFLSPIENEATKVYVRQREAKEVVPNVFTEGGMPVTVNLRYSYWLEPKHMNRHEIYYTDAERGAAAHAPQARISGPCLSVGAGDAAYQPWGADQRQNT